MRFHRGHHWILGLTLMASVSGRAAEFQGEAPPDSSAGHSLSTCALLGGDAQRNLAREVGELSFRDESVGRVVQILQEDHAVPLSFIVSDDDVKITLTLPRTTIKAVLEKIVERAPIYRYGVVAGHLLLYSRDRKWDAQLNAVNLGPGPRAKMASQLANEIARRLPPFAKFGSFLVGNGSSYVFKDQVSVVGSGTVVEILVQLLGSRPSAVFSIDKLPQFESPQLFLGGVHYWQAVKLTSPTKLMTLGEKLQLTTVGILPDGIHKDVSAAACLTAYLAADEKIVTVSADGLVTARGIGETWVQARNGDRVDALSIQVVKPRPTTPVGTASSPPHDGIKHREVR